MRTLNMFKVVCLLSLFISGTLHAQWVQTSLDSVSVRCFALSDTNLFASTSRGVYLSTNNGTSWTQTSTWSDGLLAVSGLNLFTQAGDSIYRSSNNGTSWTSAGAWHGGIKALVASGTNVYAGGCRDSAGLCILNVAISTDYGATWRDVRSGFAGGCLGVQTLAVHINESGNTDLYAGIGGCPTALPRGGVFLLANNETTWTHIGLLNAVFSSIAVVETNIFAATWDYYVEPSVFLSTNNGIVWTPANSGLTDSAVSCFAVSGTNVFAGTSHGGVFLTTNNGTNWSEVNNGLTDSCITTLAVSDSYLFAGTGSAWGYPSPGSGIWKRPLSEMITDVSPVAKELPITFLLSQNYPNPFNPSTTINYQLPTRSHVTLKVFDVLGREVATLVNGVEEPGYKSVQFDGKKLSSGLYFYRLMANDYVGTKKLLLLR